MHPHRPTLTHDPDGTPVWSQPVTAPVVGLLAWSDDPQDCTACQWTTRPVTRAVLGDRWGGPCAYHAGYDRGALHAADWYPEDDPGRMGWRRAARAAAAVLLAASYGDYDRAAAGRKDPR